MDMKRIDGTKLSRLINQKTAKQVKEIAKHNALSPGLAVILIGQDPASKVYVRMKAKQAQAIGIHTTTHTLPQKSSASDVVELIQCFNRTPEIHGILLQSPLPVHMDERLLNEQIAIDKDVDCFHPYNLGKLLIDETHWLAPCTPLGIMALIKETGCSITGKHVVILGRSTIVGKPMAILLSQKKANATVTLCHSKSTNIAAYTRDADILIAAIGHAEFVRKEMVKTGAILIDVGINWIADPQAKSGYRIVGDVAFEDVKDKVAYITPVPGGVGPMTIAMLMQNTLKACYKQNKMALDSIQTSSLY